MKTTKYNELANMLAASSKVSGIAKNSNIHNALEQILKTGIARTGHYTGSGRHTSASICTNEVVAILDKLSIPCVSGNDAPRGGASGEYVKVTMPAFLNVTNKLVKEEKARQEATRQVVLSEMAYREEKKNIVKVTIENNPRIKEEAIELFNSRLDENLSGDRRRSNRKNAKKYASNIIAEKYNLDFDAVRAIMF